MTTFHADITCPHLSPQTEEHVEYILQKELGRWGISIKITGKD